MVYTSPRLALGKAVTALAEDVVPLSVPHARLSRYSCGCHAVFRGRGFAVQLGGPLSRSRCLSTGITNGKHMPTCTGGPFPGRKESIQKLWREFFSDPSQWWDHRSEKSHPKYPDFKHKKTQQSLWLNNNLTPPWVEVELAAMAPGIIQSNIFSWNVRLRRYVKAGDFKKALDFFQQMQEEGIVSDKFTFVPVLNACSSLSALEEGRRVHLQIMKSGFENDVFVGSCLVDMYAKCGSIADAQRVFNEMPTRGVVSWNSLILGYVKCGQGQEALKLSERMQLEGVDLDPVTFVGVLNACASIGAIEEGRRAHGQVIDRGYEDDVYVASALVDMYTKCGSIEDARRVFDKMPTKDVVSWGSLIMGYVKCGQGQEALELSQQMQREGMPLDPVTLVGVLNACASIGALEEGRRAHSEIIKRGYESNAHVASSLIDMYAKCGSTEDARKVFNKAPRRDVVSWNALILGYVKCGQGQEALELSHQMQLEGVDLDLVTFVGMINACASIGALEEGKRAHEQVLHRGYECDVYVASSLVDMYSKCGSIEDARGVFNKMPRRDVVSCNALILGYVKCGQPQEALKISKQMQREGVDLDTVSFVGVLNACASIRALEEGRRAHDQIVGRGYESNAYVASSLVDMYAKCGSIADAQRVFNEMPTRDVVSWSALILGYVKCGQGQEALEVFRVMQEEGVDLCPVIFVAVLSACATIGALEEGKRIHEEIIDNGCESDVHVISCLVDMYAKCGSIEDAQRVFSKRAIKEVVSSNAMLAGYSRHGYAKEAVEHFEQMCQDVEVDAASFVSLLTACSHGGLVEEGMGYFDSISAIFDISPTMDHYACVIDLLGRAGQLHEAEDLIRKMPSEPDAPVWMSLLGACRIHGNVELGERVAEQVLVLDPGNPAGYVLLSNIFAAAGKWDIVQTVHCERLERDEKQCPSDTGAIICSSQQSLAV